MLHYNQFLKDKGPVLGIVATLFPESYRARDITDLVNSIDNQEIKATDSILPIAAFYNGKAIITLPKAYFERIDDSTCRLYDSQAEIIARFALSKFHRFRKFELLNMDSMSDEERIEHFLEVNRSEPGSELRAGKPLYNIALHYHLANQDFEFKDFEYSRPNGNKKPPRRFLTLEPAKIKSA